MSRCGNQAACVNRQTGEEEPGWGSRGIGSSSNSCQEAAASRRWAVIPVGTASLRRSHGISFPPALLLVVRVSLRASWAMIRPRLLPRISLGPRYRLRRMFLVADRAFHCRPHYPRLLDGTIRTLRNGLPGIGLTVASSGWRVSQRNESFFSGGSSL